MKTTVEYKSNHIITTLDDKYFIGNDYNEALYNLLAAGGFIAETKEMEESFTRLLSETGYQVGYPSDAFPGHFPSTDLRPIICAAGRIPRRYFLDAAIASRSLHEMYNPGTPKTKIIWTAKIGESVSWYKKL